MCWWCFCYCRRHFIEQLFCLQSFTNISVATNSWISGTISSVYIKPSWISAKYLVGPFIQNFRPLLAGDSLYCFESFHFVIFRQWLSTAIFWLNWAKLGNEKPMHFHAKKPKSLDRLLYKPLISEARFVQINTCHASYGQRYLISKNEEKIKPWIFIYLNTRKDLLKQITLQKIYIYIYSLVLKGIKLYDTYFVWRSCEKM